MPQKINLLLVHPAFPESGLQDLLTDSYILQVAENTAAALQQLAQGFEADVIMTGAVQAGADNFSLLDKLRETQLTRHLPVLLYGEAEEEEWCLQGLERGASDYLLRPFGGQQLRHRITMLLRLNKAGKRPEEAENDFLTLLMQAPVAIAVLKEPDFRFWFANALYLKIFNRAAAQVLGKTVTEVFPGVMLENVSHFFESMIHSGEPQVRFSQELKLDKQGNGRLESVYFDFIAKPFQRKGKPGSVIIIAYDTTEQVRSRKNLEAAEAEQRFLSEATKTLTTTLDYRRMLQSLAEAAVPMICDYCFIDIFSSAAGQLERIAGAHKTPTVRAEFGEIFEHVPEPGTKDHPVWEAIEAGKPIVKQGDDKWLQQMAFGSSRPGFSARILIRSLIIIPLRLGDKKLGALTLCKTGDGARYTEREMRLAGELAERVAIAVHNAHLYRQAQKEISERTEVEKALKKSEKRYRRMADTVPVIIWLTRPDGRCYYLNKQWYSFTGQRKNQGLNYGWMDALHRDDHQNAVETFKSASVRQVPFTLNMRLLSREGEMRWFLNTGIPRFTPGGKFEGFIGVVVDIHERKLAEEKLIDRERKLSLSIEAGRVGIWEKDLVHHTTSMSKELQELFGLRPGAHDTGSGDQLYKLCTHPEDVPKVVGFFKEIFRRQQKHFAQEFRIQKPDMQVAWIAEQGQVEYEEGRPVRMYGTCIDITQRKMMEQQKDDFLSIASHELKTPVTSIKGHVQLLEEVLRDKGNSWSAAQLQKVDTQIDKLVALINDLLDVTKMQAGRLEMQNEHFDLDAMVNDVVRTMQFASSRHELVRQGGTGKLVWADRHRIEQVLINLISNATKYSPEGKVIVSTEIQDNSVVVHVKDFGQGIPPDQLQRIFERFYRIRSRRYSATGLGLGLYISSEIIRAQGGSIWARSKMGEGSVFSFSLPIAEASFAHQ